MVSVLVIIFIWNLSIVHLREHFSCITKTDREQIVKMLHFNHYLVLQFFTFHATYSKQGWVMVTRNQFHFKLIFHQTPGNFIYFFSWTLSSVKHLSSNSTFNLFLHNYITIFICMFFFCDKQNLHSYSSGYISMIKRWKKHFSLIVWNFPFHSASMVYLKLLIGQNKVPFVGQ